MNRPNINWKKNDLLEYIEINLKNYNSLEETYERTVAINIKLDKALDKACEELESLDYHNEMRQNPFSYACEYRSAEEWKEWAMKDE